MDCWWVSNSNGMVFQCILYFLQEEIEEVLCFQSIQSIQFVGCNIVSSGVMKAQTVGTIV